MADRLFAYAGYWPYRCRECGARFRLPLRDYRLPATRRESSKRTDEAGPDMACRKHPERPLAKVVIEADSHEQLDQILLALGRAVHQSNHSSRATDAEFAKRR
jgi:hypothetical protein